MQEVGLLGVAGGFEAARDLFGSVEICLVKGLQSAAEPELRPRNPTPSFGPDAKQPKDEASPQQPEENAPPLPH